MNYTEQECLNICHTLIDDDDQLYKSPTLYISIIAFAAVSIFIGASARKTSLFSKSISKDTEVTKTEDHCPDDEKSKDDFEL